MNTYKFAALVIPYDDPKGTIVTDIAQTKEECLRKQYNKKSVLDLTYNIEFRVSEIGK